MFLENLGPKTSLSVPNWWRDCRTIESITYNPGTLYSGLHCKDKDVKSVQKKQSHNLWHPLFSHLWNFSISIQRLLFLKKYLNASALQTANLSNCPCLYGYSLDTIDPQGFTLLWFLCFPTPNVPKSTLLYQSLSQFHTNSPIMIISTIHPAQKGNFYLSKLTKHF